MRLRHHDDWHRHVTYANVMATLALFLVLAGGTALAAGLPKNSVNSRTVKDNSLIGADLRDETVSGADIADGSLSGADVADGALDGANVAAGSLGGAEVADGSLSGADLGKAAIGLAKLGAKSVNSATILDGSLREADIATGTVTGRNVDEATLNPVRTTSHLEGAAAGSFLSSQVFEMTTPLQRGIALGDGTFKITAECDGSDVLLSGGSFGLNNTSTVVESFPKNGTWAVRIDPHGAVDNFGVAIGCTNQAGLPE